MCTIKNSVTSFVKLTGTIVSNIGSKNLNKQYFLFSNSFLMHSNKITKTCIPMKILVVSARKFWNEYLD